MTERGSFGIVERVSMASESHDPQTLLGDEESEPEVRSSRKAEANLRLAVGGFGPRRTPDRSWVPGPIPTGTGIPSGLRFRPRLPRGFSRLERHRPNPHLLADVECETEKNRLIGGS